MVAGFGRDVVSARELVPTTRARPIPRTTALTANRSTGATRGFLQDLRDRSGAHTGDHRGYRRHPIDGDHPERDATDRPGELDLHGHVEHHPVHSHVGNGVRDRILLVLPTRAPLSLGKGDPHGRARSGHRPGTWLRPHHPDPSHGTITGRRHQRPRGLRTVTVGSRAVSYWAQQVTGRAPQSRPRPT